MILMRAVDVLGGPHDGACVFAGWAVQLPETISYPADNTGSKRHVYVRQELAPGSITYRYDHVEVGT